MGYYLERELYGARFFVGFPISEFRIQGDRSFTCEAWPDRLSECRIDGRLVNQYVYKRERDDWKVLPKRPYPRRPLQYKLRDI